ncbi:potassium voltage-gated channel subfamily A member 2 [Hydra vulgaris]|uniref:potassium voltage-gated channel subfamily A member 2 n=1 Tax=Hydra vulgaris TaxID=6087 RepID=UPI001F5FE909|nr:potassium voltage-gated channel subfamily A member 2 [Hydra vulgaris]
MMCVQVSKRICFNVSGYTFVTFFETLNRFPDTLLGNKNRRAKYFHSVSNTYFIDRSAIAFEAVLFFYQSNGRLIRPPGMSIEIFEEECLFYDLGKVAIESMKALDGFEITLKETTPIQTNRTLNKIWFFIEMPESSTPAQIYACISMILILFVVTIDCVSTVDAYKNSILLKLLNKANFYLNIFFAAEFIIRLLSSPSKWKFMTSIGNALEIFSIFPSFLLTIVEEKHTGGIIFVRVLRTLRILRLMRLSKNFHSLSVVLSILVDCFKDIIMLVFIMIVLSVFFGSIVYHAELESKDTPISSILEGMWFALQTIVTLGYGDVVPVTFFGKISSAFTAVIGALLMIIPLLYLGGNYFTKYAKACGNFANA